ncbi:MAG: cysteine desulfurase [Candidatus Neomarinimicrobiota bacterium]|nr:MAG: cysteine desulfurase [Candidatus Neomarinimicrobiota bacterium]
MLDIDQIRNDFPAYRKKDGNFIYLDSASTSQKPEFVIDAISSYYSSYAANIHRALYEIGEKATDKYEKVREKVKQFINVPDSHVVIFTGGTTESINLIAYSWGSNNLSNGDQILITEMEHHSNIVPWQLLCSRSNASLNYIPIKKDGTLELGKLKENILPKTKLISLTHQSNVFGTINPLNNIIDEAKKIGAITVIDGAQAIPHMKVDIKKLGCDFYTFSGHKMLGPTGVGVLIARKNILEEIDPFMGGGEMINSVNMDESTWNEVPWKFEAGTPNIAQVIGLGAAIDYIEKIGIENIHQHEQELLHYGLDLLDQNKDVTLYGEAENRGAVIPFNLKNIHPHDLAKFLDTDGICIRAGHHCAQPIMNKLGVSATARASFYLYNTKEDIEKLVESINKTVRIFS